MIIATIGGILCFVGAFFVGLDASEAVQAENSNRFIVELFIICGLLMGAAMLLKIGG